MWRLLASACVLALFTVACSEPPTREKHQAEGALGTARAAGADTYAPDELQAAEAALQKYDGAVDAGDYRQALAFAVEARDRAYAAARIAGNEKAAALDRANRLVTDLETLVAATNARLAGTGGPRPAGASAERLRIAVRASTLALQEARSMLDRQDYRGAVLRLTPAVEALRRETPASGPAARGRGR